jgi:D-alanyl-D-alanine-carboxypeptidase/D-alanyl-D-alanine-endopeptidase
MKYARTPTRGAWRRESAAAHWLLPAVAAAGFFGGAAAAIASSTAAEVDVWIEEQREAGAIAAAVRADIRAESYDARGFGHRTPSQRSAPDGDTQFQLGSVTKVFTHLLLAELEADGQVAYSTRVDTLMPASFAPRNPAVARITLQSLATHRSGLSRLPPNLSLAPSDQPYARYRESELHAGLVAAREQQPLGDFYAYSNFGAGTLGYLLGRVDGRGYRAALHARVLEPLQLRRTAFEPDADAAVAISDGKSVPAWRFDDAFAGTGALWGSIGDLASLVQAWLRPGSGGMKHALARDLEVLPGDVGEFALTRVWHVAPSGDAKIYWHNGGTAGFQSFVGFRPDQGRGLAILLSGDADPTATGLAALGHTPRSPSRRSHDTGIHGQYRLDDRFGIGVFERDGVLLAQASGQGPLALHAVGADWYALGEVDASLHFLRDGDDVGALELVQNGAVQRMSRVAEQALSASRREIALDASLLASYPGEYAFAPGAVLTVKREGDALQAQLSGQPYFPIHASAPDRFFYRVVDAELVFERDAAGRVVAVVLHQGGIEQRAERTQDAGPDRR